MGRDPRPVIDPNRRSHQPTAALLGRPDLADPSSGASRLARSAPGRRCERGRRGPRAATPRRTCCRRWTAARWAGPRDVEGAHDRRTMADGEADASEHRGAHPVEGELRKASRHQARGHRARPQRELLATRPPEALLEAQPASFVSSLARNSIATRRRRFLLRYEQRRTRGEQRHPKVLAATATSGKPQPFGSIRRTEPNRKTCADPPMGPLGTVTRAQHFGRRPRQSNAASTPAPEAAWLQKGTATPTARSRSECGATRPGTVSDASRMGSARSALPPIARAIARSPGGNCGGLRGSRWGSGCSVAPPASGPAWHTQTCRAQLR